MAGQPSNRSEAPGSALSLRSHASFLLRYAWFTLLILLVALGATFALTQRKERIYSASAQVMLRTPETFTLFPFASTGPRDLMRDPSTEQLYVQSGAFTGPTQQLTPPAVSVTSSISGSNLNFTARGSDPSDVASAATLWAETYVVERQVALDTAAQVDIQFINETIDDLEDERNALLEEVVVLEGLLLEATDPAVTAQLLTQKVSIESLLQPQLAPIDQQVVQFERQLSQLESLKRFIGPTDVSAQITRTASVPSSPISPNVKRNLAVGGFLGLAFGIGLPYLRRAFDDKVDDRVDAAAISGLPILGTIPSFKADETVVIEVLDRPGSLAAEHYQAVLTAIDFAAIGAPISSVLFTSSAPGDGKTTTAINIAALASQYMNVILIDADMRRPSVHDLVGGSNAVGLSNVLAGEVDFYDARFVFERGTTRFDVLQAGPVAIDPALLLRDDAWPNLIDDLFLYDLVVVDAPPVLSVTDPLLLGRAVDGQILLSKSGTTTHAELEQAAALLATNGARSLGVVVNGERVGRNPYSYYSADESLTGAASPRFRRRAEPAAPGVDGADEATVDLELTADSVDDKATPLHSQEETMAGSESDPSVETDKDSVSSLDVVGESGRSNSGRSRSDQRRAKVVSESGQSRSRERRAKVRSESAGSESGGSVEVDKDSVSGLDVGEPGRSNSGRSRSDQRRAKVRAESAGSESGRSVEVDKDSGRASDAEESGQSRSRERRAKVRSESAGSESGRPVEVDKDSGRASDAEEPGRSDSGQSRSDQRRAKVVSESGQSRSDQRRAKVVSEPAGFAEAVESDRSKSGQKRVQSSGTRRSESPRSESPRSESGGLVEPGEDSVSSSDVGGPGKSGPNRAKSSGSVRYEWGSPVAADEDSVSSSETGDSGQKSAKRSGPVRYEWGSPVAADQDSANSADD